MTKCWVPIYEVHNFCRWRRAYKEVREDFRGLEMWKVGSTKEVTVEMKRSGLPPDYAKNESQQ